MNFKKDNSIIKKNSAINSAALQDHFLKKYNFNLQTKIPITSSKSIQSDVPKRKTLQKLPSIIKKMDVQIKKLENAEKKSILPYKNEALNKLKEERQDEVKIQKYKKNLTLAQRLGLVQAPPLPLNANDWLAIQQKSKARNDSQNCCSICLQDFKVQPQVLLSCSHVFHAQCLSSYQRHNKIKCCPICRRRDYQKKTIDQALRAYTLKCILRIQRVFRGSCARISLYNRLISTAYQAKSARFKRRLIGFKMWKFSLKIEERVKLQKQYFDKLIDEIEEKYQKSKDDILAEIVQVQRKKMLQTKQVQQYLQKLGLAKQGIKKEKEIDWQTVKAKGIAREQNQCAICLMGLWGKQVCILSCSHLFHANCIQGFQRYALPGNGNKCPCCRSDYEKKLVQVFEKK